MDPDPVAIGNPRFRVAIYGIPKYGSDTVPMENELNGMAKLGWQLDHIIKWGENTVMVVYIGFVADETTGNETPA